MLDYGLSDLEPGRTARMTYLKFEACLSWPKSEEEILEEQLAASPLFPPEELEIFGACGLDLAAYELKAAFVPRGLAGDLDGDGSFDHVAQVRRRSDGKCGLVICRAGTWLHLLGLDGRAVGEALRPVPDRYSRRTWIRPKRTATATRRTREDESCRAPSLSSCASGYCVSSASIFRIRS